MLIPFVMAHSHGGHHTTHTTHTTQTKYTTQTTHKLFTYRYIETSVIATYLIFNDFKGGVENLFYINYNYYNYNITYYVKNILLDDNIKECIYYVASENFNNESIIDASNMKIVENTSFIHNYGNNLYRFCKTLDNKNNYNILVTTVVVLIMLCCIAECLCGSNNYSNRNLY